jgi:hypothetical protein
MVFDQEEGLEGVKQRSPLISSLPSEILRIIMRIYTLIIQELIRVSQYVQK